MNKNNCINVPSNPTRNKNVSAIAKNKTKNIDICTTICTPTKRWIIKKIFVSNSYMEKDVKRL